MILLIAGTTEGRVLFNLLKGSGLKMAVSFLTEYGSHLLKGEHGDKIELLRGPLDKEHLVKIIQQKGITEIIDASHPFAVEISKNALETSREQGVAYFRFERPSIALPKHSLIKQVSGFQEAAKEAVCFGKVIFLTVGVKNLEPFIWQAKEHGRDVVARVLPLESSIQACREKGLQPPQILALQGPGSRELNRELLKYYKAGVLVTKDSGAAGGTAAKIEAALELDIPVIFIQRPSLDYGKHVYYGADELVKEVLLNKST